MKLAPQRFLMAFTLVEVMIVVALIGLLTVLAIPSFLSVRRQTQGRRVINDARIIDLAIDHWAMEEHQPEGVPVDLEKAAAYLKGGRVATNDILGNPYIIGRVGSGQVRIAPATKTALNDVSIDWGAY